MGCQNLYAQTASGPSIAADEAKAESESYRGVAPDGE